MVPGAPSYPARQLVCPDLPPCRLSLVWGRAGTQGAPSVCALALPGPELLGPGAAPAVTQLLLEVCSPRSTGLMTAWGSRSPSPRARPLGSAQGSSRCPATRGARPAGRVVAGLFLAAARAEPSAPSRPAEPGAERARGASSQAWGEPAGLHQLLGMRREQPDAGNEEMKLLKVSWLHPKSVPRCWELEEGGPGSSCVPVVSRGCSEASNASLGLWRCVPCGACENLACPCSIEDFSHP